MDRVTQSYSTTNLPMRFQSQLGKEFRRRYKEENNLIRLTLARVVKVNYKYNTVDVVTVRYGDTLVKNPTDEGKFSARLPVSFGGRTPDGKVYGANTLVTVGSLVLVGFLEGKKEYPIVLNIYGELDNQSMLTRTELTGADEADEAIQREIWQLFTLYPSMTYHNVDGRGNQEITFSGKSFMYITDTDQENEYVTDYGFDYDHLPSAYYANGELIEPTSPKSPTLIYVHQGVYDNHRVTFFIKSDGTVRVGSRHVNDTGITFYELKTDGTFEIVQKRDTDNPEEESNRFSKIGITRDGSVILQAEKHVFEVTDKGIFVNGRPISLIGGEFSLEDYVDGSNTIELKNGKIELKASNHIVDELEDKITAQEARINFAVDEISTKVSRTELETDLQEVKDFTTGLIQSVNTEIGEVYSAIEDLEKSVQDAVEDGVITGAEAIAISKYINQLNKEKVDIDARYDEVYNNGYLPEDDRNRLAQAKFEFDNAHLTLLQVISTAIQDKKTTPEESEAVDQAFNGYSEKLVALNVQFEKSIDSIARELAKEALRNANEYTEGKIQHVESEIRQLADEISLRVTEEEFSRTTQTITQEIQKVSQEVTRVEGEVGEVAQKIPYNAVIISTNGNIFKNGGVTTTLHCRVYRGDEDITDQIDASRFRWTRVSDDLEGDAEWNARHSQGTKTITLTSEDVPGRATFNCDILEETTPTTTTTV